MGEPGDSSKGKGGRKGDSVHSHMRHLGLGTHLALMMVIGVVGGNWLDEKTGWDPLFVLSGSVLGITAGIWAVHKEVSGTKR